MFTDIVGYTAMMGSDEEKAIELVKKSREIQRPLIVEFGGILLDEIGDGNLASFPNYDAVELSCPEQESPE